MSNVTALYLFIAFIALVFMPMISSELDTTYFRIAADGIIAVVGYPSNNPPILEAMLDSGLWVTHIIEAKKVDEINVILYNMEQLAFESSALPAVNKQLVSNNTYLAFDQSKGIARPDVAIGGMFSFSCLFSFLICAYLDDFVYFPPSGITEILESVKMTADRYMQYIIISQSADFRDARTREFNSILPSFTNVKIPEFTPLDPSSVKKFLCLIGSPKAHKLIFGTLLHHHGLLHKSIEWSAGSLVGNSVKEVREEAKRRARKDRSVDLDAFDKFVNKLPNIIDVDPSVEKQHDSLNPSLYARGKIHIVLESEDHSPDVELCDMQFRYTEKTIKSIFFGYPFLVYGNFGTLKLLEAHGFQTFHPYINETYDLISIRHHRVHALVTEIARLNSLSNSEFETLLFNLKPITMFNQELLSSKAFKEKLRAQGEYALGLIDTKSIDYSDLEKIANDALQSVNAPKCSLPTPDNCNPVCGYTIYHKNHDIKSKYGNDGSELTGNRDEEEKKSSSKESRKSEGEEDHELVFEDAKGRVIDSEQDVKVTENNKNMPIPLKDDIIIKPKPKAKGLEKKKHEDDDDTMAGVLSEANADTKKHEDEEEKGEEEEKIVAQEETSIKEGNGESHDVEEEEEVSKVIEPVPLRNKALGSAIESE